MRILVFLQTYLEQNEGPGLQHLALKTNDIIHTVGEMAKRSQCGGFEFMPRPSAGYYGKVTQKVVSLDVYLAAALCVVLYCLAGFCLEHW